jgi:hypothetical protein
MRANNSEHVTTIAVELAWLLGSWAFSFAVVGWLFGFKRLLTGPLDIQLHNTYFRLTTGYAVFPFFVFVATVVTGARGVIARFKQVSINTVLALLGLLWGLLLFVVYALLTSSHQ